LSCINLRGRTGLTSCVVDSHVAITVVGVDGVERDAAAVVISGLAVVATVT
jgi:hypothetical protein